MIEMIKEYIRSKMYSLPHDAVFTGFMKQPSSIFMDMLFWQVRDLCDNKDIFNSVRDDSKTNVYRDTSSDETTHTIKVAKYTCSWVGPNFPGKLAQEHIKKEILSEYNRRLK